MKISVLSQKIPFAGRNKSMGVVLLCFILSVCISLAYVYFWYFGNPDSFRNDLISELQQAELAVADTSKDTSLVSFDRQKQIQDYAENEIKIMKLRSEFK